MYSTLAYLYQQTQVVLLLDNCGAYHNVRWNPVYSKNLKASKGVDNVILFRFLNQDQKPVDITGLTFTCRVMSRDGTELLFARDLETVSATRGQAKLTIVESDLDNVQSQLANYSITVDRSTLTEPVYVDDNAGARGVLYIADSAMPEFVASSEITLPSFTAGQTNYSSEWQPEQYLQTVQYTNSSFVGTVTVQGSPTGTEWYDLTSATFSSADSNTKYINVEGLHSYMRLKVDSTSGTVGSVYVR